MDAVAEAPTFEETCAEAVAYIDRRDAGITLRPGGRGWRCRTCGECFMQMDMAWCHWRDLHEEDAAASDILRALRREAHLAFDPLWMAKKAREGIPRRQAQEDGYAWLGIQLGLPTDLRHIGYFDAATCRRVIELCNRYRKAK